MSMVIDPSVDSSDFNSDISVLESESSIAHTESLFGSSKCRLTILC